MSQKPDAVTVMLAGLVQSDVTLDEILAILDIDRTVLTTFPGNEDGLTVHAFALDTGSDVQIIEKTGSRIPLTISSSDGEWMGYFAVVAAAAGYEVRFRYFAEPHGLFCAHLFKREAVKTSTTGMN